MRAVFAAMRRSSSEGRNRFYVPATRRAQDQPLGLEDGNTALARGLVAISFQRSHGTGSCRKPKGGAGIPVSPFSEPNWARRLDWMPADLI